MIVAAALLPHPPLLLREVSGAADPAADLRTACLRAVSATLGTGPDVVHLVGADGPPVTPASFAPSPVIKEPRRDQGRCARPLSLLVGHRVLDQAGWSGPVADHPVAHDASAADCARLGARLAAGDERAALLVLGDGSARRGPKAPGYVDERAQPFDAEVLEALGTADGERLGALDAVAAAELLAAGRPAWQVLAGALPALGVTAGEVLYADDPFGVAYVVCTYRP